MHFCTTLYRESRAARTTSKIPRLFTPTYWRHKNITLFSIFSFTRQLSFFSVVAPKFFHGSGTKPSKAIISLSIKGEIESAINMKAVPSFSIFQKISDFAMSGQELCPNA
jgi:hypothetical protein